MERSNSPTKKIWLRFRKNKPAAGGLLFICLLLLMGILGYLITPDQTPMANTMHLQLTNKKPGRKFQFLKISENRHIPRAGLFHKMCFGQKADYKSMPITSYRVSGRQLLVKEYLGDDEEAAETSFPLTGSPDAFISERIYVQTFWLGTDGYGRDLFSRLILGIRVSLSVGLMAVIISMSIGLTLGALAGYFGGFTDAVVSWLMNVIWSLPSLLLVIAISFALGKGFWQIFIAVGLSTWVDVARLVRGQVMAVRQAEFVEAARALGFSTPRILLRHILPNIAGPVLVMASANFASAILLETGLSFLGFGAQPPMPSWGSMIQENYGYIVMDAAYLAILPGLAIMLTVYAFNLMAIGLRDAFDIRSQQITL